MCVCVCVCVLRAVIRCRSAWNHSANLAFWPEEAEAEAVRCQLESDFLRSSGVAIKADRGYTRELTLGRRTGVETEAVKLRSSGVMADELRSGDWDDG